MSETESAVVYREDPDSAVAEIVVDGRVTRADFDAVAPRLEAFIAAHGKIRLIEIVRRLDGFDPGLLWDGFRFDMRALPHITHCAVVGDIGWLTPLSRAAGAFMSTKLRTFPMAELDAARAWIADPDAG